MATLQPVNKCGVAIGMRKRRKIDVSEARNECIKSSIALGTASNPATTFTKIGKKQTRITITIFGNSPTPSHRITSGASATLGTDCRPNRIG